MGITEFLATYITAFIEETGYPSVFVFMVMESMLLLGSIVGSLISYCIGLYGGKPAIKRYGRYLLLDHRDLQVTERFFARRGELAIFISRFIPVIRHLISIPAGIGRMNVVTFSAYTVVGAGLWNAFLAVVGFHLRQHWELVMRYSRVVDIVVLLILIVLLALFVYRHLMRRNEGVPD
jgi:membrane protein DedA with SNARE-associated domain